MIEIVVYTHFDEQVHVIWFGKCNACRSIYNNYWHIYISYLFSYIFMSLKTCDTMDISIWQDVLKKRYVLINQSKYTY